MLHNPAFFDLGWLQPDLEFCGRGYVSFQQPAHFRKPGLLTDLCPKSQKKGDGLLTIALQYHCCAGIVLDSQVIPNNFTGSAVTTGPPVTDRGNPVHVGPAPGPLKAIMD